MSERADYPDMRATRAMPSCSLAYLNGGSVRLSQIEGWLRGVRCVGTSGIIADHRLFDTARSIRLLWHHAPQMAKMLNSLAAVRGQSNVVRGVLHASVQVTAGAASA